MLGYEATLTEQPFRETGQSVAPGTIWESRLGETRVTVVASNTVWVWFQWFDPVSGGPLMGDDRYDHFLGAFHQVK